jgi:hypothetical protein
MPRGRPRKGNTMLLKSAELIGWALGGLEREIAQTRDRLSSLTAQATKLRKRLGVRLGRPAVAAAGGASATQRAGRKRRRPMSAAGRRRISEAMKKRWAEHRRKKAKTA